MMGVQNDIPPAQAPSHRATWLNRTRLLRALVGVVGLAALAVITLFARYLINPRPIEELIHPDLGLDVPPHYLGSLYNVDGPVGVAISPDGAQIYVSESGSQRRVLVYDRDGRQIDSWLPGAGAPDQRSPVYLAVDRDGLVLVSDRRRHLIAVYAPDGALQSEYSPGWSPLGLRLDTDGNVLATSVSGDRHSVHRLSVDRSTGALSLLDLGVPLGASDSELEQLNFPNSAVSDALGRIYVSDGNNWRIAVWDAQGRFLYHFGAGAGEEAVSLPRGLFIDRRQRLYVVDASAHKVKVYSLTGDRAQFLFDFGDPGTGDENFQYPADIAIDSSDRIYVCDRENNRVQIWAY